MQIYGQPSTPTSSSTDSKRKKELEAEIEIYSSNVMQTALLNKYLKTRRAEGPKNLHVS